MGWEYESQARGRLGCGRVKSMETVIGGLDVSSECLSNGHLEPHSSGLRTIVTHLLPIHVPYTILDALVTNLPPPPNLLKLCS